MTCMKVIEARARERMEASTAAREEHMRRWKAELQPLKKESARKVELLTRIKDANEAAEDVESAAREILMGAKLIREGMRYSAKEVSKTREPAAPPAHILLHMRAQAVEAAATAAALAEMALAMLERPEAPDVEQ